MERNNIEKMLVSKGISFNNLLGIVFIVLKLCGVINWSWVWVVAPIWVPFAILLGLIILYGLALLISSLINRWE